MDGCFAVPSQYHECYSNPTRADLLYLCGCFLPCRFPYLTHTHTCYTTYNSNRHEYRLGVLRPTPPTGISKLFYCCIFNVYPRICSPPQNIVMPLPPPHSPHPPSGHPHPRGPAGAHGSVPFNRLRLAPALKALIVPGILSPSKGQVQLRLIPFGPLLPTHPSRDRVLVRPNTCAPAPPPSRIFPILFRFRGRDSYLADPTDPPRAFLNDPPPPGRGRDKSSRTGSLLTAGMDPGERGLSLGLQNGPDGGGEALEGCGGSDWRGEAPVEVVQLPPGAGGQD